MRRERSVAPMADLVLILAPTGRDAAIVQRLLGRENIDCQICPSLETLNQAISDETGVVLIADEALGQENLTPLARHLTDQPPWSDLPFIVLTRSDAVARRTLGQLNLPEALGNVMFLERPFNTVSLTSAIRTALRARRRQRQVRDHIIEQAISAEQLRMLNETLEACVAERTKALRASEAALHNRKRWKRLAD